MSDEKQEDEGQLKTTNDDYKSASFHCALSCAGKAIHHACEMAAAAAIPMLMLSTSTREDLSYELEHFLEEMTKMGVARGLASAGVLPEAIYDHE